MVLLEQLSPLPVLSTYRLVCAGFMLLGLLMQVLNIYALQAQLCSKVLFLRRRFCIALSFAQLWNEMTILWRPIVWIWSLKCHLFQSVILMYISFCSQKVIRNWRRVGFFPNSSGKSELPLISLRISVLSFWVWAALVNFNFGSCW